MIGIKKALLVSEVGWKGMKEFSSSLIRRDFLVNIIIKGSVNKEVLEVITRPKGLRIYAVPKIFFKPYLLFYLLWHRIRGGLKTAVVSKEQTKNWIRGFGLEAKILIEEKEGYKII